MADNKTKEQRSYNMSRILSRNTKPEIVVRKFIFSKGFRYRLHTEKLTGKPDIVLNKLKSVIFINGCFWHGHKKCKYAKTPASNRKFWVNKITANMLRDKANIITLKKEGWKVYVIWECQLIKAKQDKTLAKLLIKLLGEN